MVIKRKTLSIIIYILFFILLLGAVLEIVLVTSCSSRKNENLSLEESLKDYTLINAVENEVSIPNNLTYISKDYSYSFTKNQNLYSILFFKKFQFFKEFQFLCETAHLNKLDIVLFQNYFCFVISDPQVKIYKISLDNNCSEIVEFEEQGIKKIFSIENTIYLYETNQGTNIYKVNLDTKKLTLIEHFEEIIDTISFITNDTKGKLIIQSKANNIYYNGDDWQIRNAPLIKSKGMLYSFYHTISSNVLQEGFPIDIFKIDCLNDQSLNKALSLTCNQNFTTYSHRSENSVVFICEIQEPANTTNLVLIQYSFEADCFSFCSLHIHNLKKYDFFGEAILVITEEKSITYTI